MTTAKQIFQLYSVGYYAVFYINDEYFPEEVNCLHHTTVNIFYGMKPKIKYCNVSYTYFVSL